jgi:hypothetical protein
MKELSPLRKVGIAFKGSKFNVQSLKLRADLDATSKFKVNGWVALDRHAT